MPDSDIIHAVSADNVRAYVEYVCEHIPSRLAGSENGARIAQYNKEALQRAGVDAWVDEFPALVSFPHPCTLQVLAPRSVSFAAHTSGHSVPTPPEGVQGEVVFVGAGHESQYEGKDVAGKIVLCEMSYSPARMEKQRIATLRGAVGVIFINWGYEDSDALPYGSVKPAWGNPTPDVKPDEMVSIPCVGVSRRDGLQLKSWAEAGALRVTVEAKVENEWRPVQLTTGRIDAPDSEDFVLVGGHQDSWPGPAATDNAAGNACMVELARVFASRRGELRRGLQFGFWPAHETGTMAGSAWFADRNWDRLRAHAVAYLLIDQPACTGTTRWLTMSNLEMREFHQAIERRLLSVPCDWKPQKKGGDASFFGLGVPMFYGMAGFTHEELKATADANMGWWHHSPECTIDKVDFAWMQSHLQVYAAWLWELCTTPILPFDFTAVARQFAGRLEELRDMRGLEALDLAPVASRARVFEEWAVRLNGEVRRQRERFREGNQEDERIAARLNDCQKRLSNILIPIQSTVKGVYGHDPYGYTPQLTPIPCLYETRKLADLKEDTEERWMLETELRRQRNRVADALAEAVMAVRTAVDSA